MIITYHGAGFIKASFGDTTLAFSPISKDSKISPTRFGADVALISINHDDANGIAEVTRGDTAPFAVTGPGEYEVRGVTIKGTQTKSNYGGKEERINTVYAVRMEDMNLLYLGALSDGSVGASVTEDMESVDVVFVPIGGDGVLDAGEAHKLAVSFEPKIIIPIFGADDKDALKTFLKEAGTDVKPVDKLTIKRKDIESMSGEVVVLSH
jgi:L-ascorbate metabolism protein UlaG (beta-lactamase superfamily)